MKAKRHHYASRFWPSIAAKLRRKCSEDPSSEQRCCDHAREIVCPIDWAPVLHPASRDSFSSEDLNSRGFPLGAFSWVSVAWAFSKSQISSEGSVRGYQFEFRKTEPIFHTNSPSITPALLSDFSFPFPVSSPSVTIPFLLSSSSSGVPPLQAQASTDLKVSYSRVYSSPTAWQGPTQW